MMTRACRATQRKESERNGASSQTRAEFYGLVLAKFSKFCIFWQIFANFQFFHFF